MKRPMDKRICPALTTKRTGPVECPRNCGSFSCQIRLEIQMMREAEEAEEEEQQNTLPLDDEWDNWKLSKDLG
jgi:hypothetical protein